MRNEDVSKDVQISPNLNPTSSLGLSPFDWELKKNVFLATVGDRHLFEYSEMMRGQCVGFLSATKRQIKWAANYDFNWATLK